MSFQFHQGTISYGKLVEVIAEVFSPMALSDVGRNGNCCPLNLAGQSIGFGLRQLGRKRVTLNHEVHGLLPNQQISITVDSHLSLSLAQKQPIT